MDQSCSILLLPNISRFFEPLEEAIKDKFIPAITKKNNLTQGQRDLLSLPTRSAGMGISNPMIMADQAYSQSQKNIRVLAELIMEQKLDYHDYDYDKAKIGI